MMKSFRAQGWLALKKMILAVGIVGALHAAAVTQAAASASCTAVNSGSFSLTNPAADPGNTSILTGFAVGDRITATFTDAIGFDHSDGFFKGPTVSGIGLLEQATVPHGGSVQVMHNVVAGDLTNGILLDPENFDSVTATCITALVLTSTPSATLHVNQSYSQSNVASGGTASYTYSVSGGAVPAGTSLNTATGLVSGTPTAGGPFSYTVTATDSSPAPALTVSQTISGGIIPANSSSTSLTSSVNPSILGAAVTFTAIVTGPGGTPTGSVTFYDGPTSLGSNALVSGTAALSTSALTVGSHSISAVYSGDANYATSTSSTLSQAVVVVTTYVSGYSGVDAGICTRDLPCATFSYALSFTAAGGEIDVLDPGDFGSVTITKSITISSENLEGGVLLAGTNGIVVDAPGGAVILRGLNLEGLGPTGGSLNGIDVIAAVGVHIEKCVIRGFQSNGSSGVHVAPSSGAVQVAMDNVIVSENAGPTSGNAVTIQPTGGAKVNATFHNVRLINNASGFRFDGTNGPISAVIRNSASSHNTRAGVSAIGANTVNVLSDGSVFIANGSGVIANGTGVSIRLTRSAVTANSTGLIISSGAITSNGDNEIDNNAADGPAPSTVSHK
jgi:Bacterial Ig-like domain (group 3)